MGSRVPAKGVKNISKLYYVQKKRPLWHGMGRDLPKAYKRYWVERHQQPTAVHYIPEEGKYKRDPVTGVTSRVENVPLPLIYPKEFHRGLWGGEAIVQGYRQKDPFATKFPNYWVPRLKFSIVYSEVLDKYWKVVVTDRTIQLINEHYGLDHYLLQTPASDLISDLALKMKRQILLALDRNELPHKDATKRQEVYDAYKHYLQKYDSQYIEWYGLKLWEAVSKKRILDGKDNKKPVPLKEVYRHELLSKLAVEGEDSKEEVIDSSLTSKFNKWNPFKSK